MNNYKFQISFVIILSAIFITDIINPVSSEGTKQKKSVIMDDTKVKGEVEKPEFINIIQRRRVEFQDKGELNVSFHDKIFAPVIKNKFENDFSQKVNQILDRGSITAGEE